MDHRPSSAAARLLLTLTVLPTALLAPAVAAADVATPSTKAQIEHAEQISARTVTKAQVEHAERASATTAAARTTATTTTRSPATGGSDGGDAAAWQLAVSAALGAVLTGAALLTARRVVDHRRPLAS
jgi:hypothetical protein